MATNLHRELCSPNTLRKRETEAGSPGQGNNCTTIRLPNPWGLEGGCLNHFLSRGVRKPGFATKQVAEDRGKGVGLFDLRFPHLETHLLLLGPSCPYMNGENTAPRRVRKPNKTKQNKKPKRQAHTNSDWERSTLFTQALRSTPAACPLGRDLKSGQRRTWSLAFLQAWQCCPHGSNV